MIEEFKDVKEIQLIIFQLGKEEYAVPITNVQEIIMVRPATKIPKTPSFVEGVINLRGRIIPVIDGRKKFNLDTKNNFNENDSRIMVLDVEHEIIGLIVDAVSEVIHLKTEDIVPPPVDMEDETDFLWGVGKLQDRLLILINPEKFLSHNEVKDLKNLSKFAESINQTQEKIETQTATK